MADLIYTVFETDDIVNDVPTRVTQPLWYNNESLLTGSLMVTSSVQSGSTGKYYYDVYNTSTGSQVEFSITYGHSANSGTLSSDLDKPSQAMYALYRNLLLDSATSKFLVGSSYVDDIVVLSINRANIKQRIDPGNWQLTLTSGSVIRTLIDDSFDSTDLNAQPNKVYNIISGSIGATTNAFSKYFGLVYPDAGLFVLSGNALRSSSSDTSLNIEFGYNTGSDAYYNNHGKVLKYITAFQGRSEDIISSTHYYVRIKNTKYNYSTNNTYITGSSGDLRYTQFIQDPKTYITTVGLYDEQNTLLAIAKLSKPVKKAFDTETNIQVRLDY